MTTATRRKHLFLLIIRKADIKESNRLEIEKANTISQMNIL